MLKLKLNILHYPSLIYQTRTKFWKIIFFNGGSCKKQKHYVFEKLTSQKLRSLLTGQERRPWTSFLVACAVSCNSSARSQSYPRSLEVCLTIWYPGHESGVLYWRHSYINHWKILFPEGKRTIQLTLGFLFLLYFIFCLYSSIFLTGSEEPQVYKL